MGAIDEQFVSSDKAQASTLMAKLCSMRLKGTQNVRGHIMEMRDVSAQLKALAVDFSESFLVHFILTSLPADYTAFKVSYMTHKEKWSVNELLTDPPIQNSHEEVVSEPVIQEPQQVVQTAPQSLDQSDLRRSSRVRKSAIPSDYVVYLQETDYMSGLNQDPISFSEAMSRTDSEKWSDAMKDELNSMANNQVWDLVELPEGFRAVGCKWVYKTKTDASGNIERYKARLVAKGFLQKEGIDYHDTFSPVSKKDSLRIIMALVAHFDLELHQMDVKTTFLNGELEEEVYMTQPEGFISEKGNNLVCKLKKSIYGLKQASRQWYMKFHNIITSFGFEENIVDQCIYIKVSGRKFTFLVLYVDDILLASNNLGLIRETK